MYVLQETKLKDSDVEACERILRPTLPGWHFYWNNSVAKKGYSGVALLSRCGHIRFFLRRTSLLPHSYRQELS